jgi:hypothetical protein
VIDALHAAYHDTRRGLGFTKSPAVYGAFPTDPYSHTPRHAGAQQPGMTGQVKEEILTRFGELGVKFSGGCLAFEPRLLPAEEFDPEPRDFSHVDVAGREASWGIPAGSLAFTYAQVPICYRLAEAASITIERADGSETIAGTTLSAADSAAILARSGSVKRLLVDVPRSQLRPAA